MDLYSAFTSEDTEALVIKTSNNLSVQIYNA